MDKEELKKWFWNKFNSCYQVRHGTDVYFYYNETFLRQKKLCRTLGKEIKPPKEVNGEFYFKLDLKNKFLFCNYNKVWLFLHKQKIGSYLEIQSFIKDILKEDTKMSVFTPSYLCCSFYSKLKEDPK